MQAGGCEFWQVWLQPPRAPIFGKMMRGRKRLRISGGATAARTYFGGSVPEDKAYIQKNMEDDYPTTQISRDGSRAPQAMTFCMSGAPHGPSLVDGCAVSAAAWWCGMPP